MIVELEELTIRALMERTFALYAELPAIGLVGELPKSYQEVQTSIKNLSMRILSQNIGKGDKVAILGDNCPNWVISYLAITYIGAVAVPILPGFPDADVRHIIRNSETTAIFIGRKFMGKIEGLGKSHLHTIFTLEDFSVKELERETFNIIEKTSQMLSKKDGKKSVTQALTGEFPEPEPDDLAAIIYTSGTTGHSKGVMLTHRNIVSNVVHSIEKFPIDSNDRFLSILPLSHTFEATGGMLCALAVGVTIFYLEGLPTPQKLLASMETVRPTGLLAVPLVIDKIYRKRILPQIQSKKLTNRLYQIRFFRKLINKLAGKKLLKSLGGRLRFFMFGGAALNPDVEIFLKEAGISYSTGYGLTENSPIVSINPFGQVKMGSCGQPVPGIEVKILEPDGTTGVGEIIVRGPSVMQGYYKNPEATQQIFLEEGWLKTGDLGYLDEDGYLFIKGRSKNVIIGSSGENIYPEIIEQKLQQSPYVQEVVVYQSQDKLVAKVYLDYDVLDREFEHKNLSEADAKKVTRDLLEQIRKDINLELPGFSSISKLIEYPEPFEKTPTNKVKRYLYVDQE